MYPPQFWDNLSRIPLVESALRELDRRNSETRLWEEGLEDARQLPSDAQWLEVGIISQDIHRFSRNGGPDLSEFRGVHRSTGLGRHTRGVNRIGVSQNFGTGSCERSTTPTSTRAGPYDPAFMQHLLEYNILPLEYEVPDDQHPAPPDNMREITAEICAKRGSEPVEDFRSFQRAYRQASNEEDALNQIDSLQGDKTALMRSHAIRQKKKMNQLAPLTDGSIAHGNPDRVYGSRAAELALFTRERLKDLIVPTPEQDFICPNFVVHAKGLRGTAAVASVQAVYDGALAARGMQALWEFGDGPDGIVTQDPARGASKLGGSRAILRPRSHRSTEPGPGLVVDAQVSRVARTITCTWVYGVLKIYAVHCEPSPGIREGDIIEGRQAAGAPRYVSTLIGSWIMTDREDHYREGLRAYRNALDWAKRQRDMAISRANARGQAEDARRRRDEEKKSEPVM
ncbi:hypothetical protein KVR01_012747 [Diaporthe batatas]|uniref:uncharacterized protein n=1 Tax=Diaporthe batatas TaxID=748121 RepID=UPI001D03749D|nr:uncharacterized protein KVR01_012747 [Diaporthe batatas]KAG8157363.1 hypothetical protein KVR01_012747 [Diaporthe batatas]